MGGRRFARKVIRDKVLLYLKQHKTITAHELAKLWDIDIHVATDYLLELAVDTGLIKSKVEQIGNKGFIKRTWYLNKEGIEE